MSNRVVWLSLDPVRRKIDYYPKSLSMRIEEKYQNKMTLQHDECFLGADFFNATIHFTSAGTVHQTTPGIALGRAGMKVPGFRSVKRVIVPLDDRIEIYAKQIHGEWRISNPEHYPDHIFREIAPIDCIINLTGNITNMLEDMEIMDDIHNWTIEDLERLNSFNPGITTDVTITQQQEGYNSIANKKVYVWQWCRGVPERQGNLMRLSDEWWSPYNQGISSDIERAFQNKELFTNVDIPIIGSRTITFMNNYSMYATQHDPARHTIRVVRRIVTTVKELQEIFDTTKNGNGNGNGMTSVIDIESLIEKAIENGMEIPHEFYCSISQDIMNDPVITCDGHTYDRYSIERWFQYNSTSPLTGLRLDSTVLISNMALKNAIDKYFQFVKDKSSSSNEVLSIS